MDGAAADWMGAAVTSQFSSVQKSFLVDRIPEFFFTNFPRINKTEIIFFRIK